MAVLRDASERISGVEDGLRRTDIFLFSIKKEDDPCTGDIVDGALTRDPPEE